MLYNIEVAQSFSLEKKTVSDSFYVSILKSFEEAMRFINENRIMKDFEIRIENIVKETWKQDWFNKITFDEFANKKPKV